MFLTVNLDYLEKIEVISAIGYTSFNPGYLVKTEVGEFLERHRLWTVSSCDQMSAVPELSLRNFMARFLFGAVRFFAKVDIYIFLRESIYIYLCFY